MIDYGMLCQFASLFDSDGHSVTMRWAGTAFEGFFLGSVVSLVYAPRIYVMTAQ